MVTLKELEFYDEEKFEIFEKRYKEECVDEEIPFCLNKDNLSFSCFLKTIQSLDSSKTIAKCYLILVDNTIVGAIRLCYGETLNYDSHIEYAITPWERNKGYAKRALQKLLVVAKNMNISRLSLTTYENNLASQKVIEACGGQYEKTLRNKRFYWIELGAWILEESAMAIVFYENKILSTYEFIYGNTILSCPKGHIEKDESHMDTAIRECFEETNVILSMKEYIAEVEVFTVKFVNHHNQFIEKRIYPICFKVAEEGTPLAKEERILSVQYMDIEHFLDKCSYENVRQIVASCLKFIN